MKKSGLKSKVSWCILLAACLMLLFKWVIPETLRSAHVIFTLAPQARTWPTAKGRARWHMKVSARATGQNNSSSWHICEYEFVVDGVKHVGKQMRVGEASVAGEGITGFTVAELKDRYEDKDGFVTVHYDPNDPSQCVLDPELSGSRIFWFIATPIICAFVLFFFCWTAYRHLKTSVD